MRRGICLSLAVAVVGLVGPGAQAGAYSSGSLTNAYADADWTNASFNVSVTGPERGRLTPESEPGRQWQRCAGYWDALREEWPLVSPDRRQRLLARIA